MSFGDLYTVQPGQGNPPGVPPVDLPKGEAPPPRKRLNIEVRPDRTDPYAAYSDTPAAPPQQSGDPYAAYSDAPPEKRPSRDIGPGESAARGAIESLTFGTAPALSGLAAAGKTTRTTYIDPESGVAVNPESGVQDAIAGLVRVGLDHFLSPEGKATEAYRKARDELRQTQESAFGQNPKSYIAGQVGGALVTPGLSGARAATAAGRIGKAARGGAAAGGLYGTGEAISEGQSPGDVALSGAKGAATGALFGTAGAGAIEGGAKVINRARNVGQGVINPEAVAARTIRDTMRSDAAGRGMGLDRPTYEAAQRSGMPLYMVDYGGQGTRDLGRAAANISPQAWDALEKVTTERAEGRPERLRAVIDRMFGGTLDAGADQIKLEQAARKANRVNYGRAYAAGSRPIWSPELERLTSSDAVRGAIKGAITRGKDRAVAEGFGGFRPGVRVTPDGRIEFPSGPKGIPTYPDLRFWDYTQRELSDAANAAARAGRNEEAATLKGVLHDLKAELDRQVPEFKAARQGAAQFFGAEDASEAGRKFVMMNADPREASRALAKMSPPERELFARGFADDLGQAVLRNGSMGTIKRAFTAPLARQKIETALGPARAKELEVTLRAELVADKTKAALGNSTTTRQQELMRALKAGVSASGTGHGLAGAGAVGAFEFIKDGQYDFKSILGGALLLGAMKRGAHKVDVRVFRHIGEMLASEDPAVLSRGVKAVARSPQLFDAMRKGTELGTAAGARIIAHDVGGNRTAAAAAALIEHVLAEEDTHHQRGDDPNAVSQPVNQ